MSQRNFNRGGRNSRGGYSPSMGGNDPRQRTNAVQGRTGDDLGSGMTLDRRGRVVPDIDETSGLMLLANGKIGIDHSKFAQAAAAFNTFNVTNVGGGSGSGGSSAGTTINNFLDDTLAGYAL